MTTAPSPDDPIIFVSPTEPAALRSIGTVSQAVEAKGCDVLIVLPEHRIGIQRKTWIDLIMSLDDGRLANSIPKMDMGVRVVIIEGKLEFDRADHVIVRSRSKAKNVVGGWAHLRHTRESLAGVIFSLRYTHGLDVFKTESLSDTIMVVQRLGKYLAKTDHKGIVGDRPRVNAKDAWGVDDPTRRKMAQRVNFLMGLGIGYKTAVNLLKANKGTMPIRWTVSAAQLSAVPLIGPATAARLLEFLDSG